MSDNIWAAPASNEGSIFQFELPTNLGQDDHGGEHQA